MAIGNMDFGSGSKGGNGGIERGQRLRRSDSGLDKESVPEKTAQREVTLSNEPKSDSLLVCPNCGSRNIRVQVVEQGQKTARKGTGPLGNTNNLLRLLVGICTCGIGFFFWKKSEGTMRTKTVTSTVAVCQSCGNTWMLDSPVSDESSDDARTPTWKIVLIVLACLLFLSYCVSSRTSRSSSSNSASKGGISSESSDVSGTLDFNNVNAKITGSEPLMKLVITGDVRNSTNAKVKNSSSIFSLATPDGKAITSLRMSFSDGVGNNVREMSPGDVVGFECSVSLNDSGVRDCVVSSGDYKCVGLDGLSEKIRAAFDAHDKEVQAAEEERQAEAQRQEEERQAEEQRREEERAQREAESEQRRQAIEEEFRKASEPKIEVSIGDARSGTDLFGKPCLIVDYTLTNVSDDNGVNFASVNDKAYQNGVECTSTIFSDAGDGNAAYRDIKPGASVSVSVSYILVDTSSKVDVEVTESVFSSKVIASKSFDIG